MFIATAIAILYEIPVLGENRGILESLTFSEVLKKANEKVLQDVHYDKKKNFKKFMNKLSAVTVNKKRNVGFVSSFVLQCIMVSHHLTRQHTHLTHNSPGAATPRHKSCFQTQAQLAMFPPAMCSQLF